MDGYLCLKACTLGGTDYNAGDTIPKEAVLPSRVRALTRQKYIAPAAGTTETPTGAPQTPQNEPNEPAPLVIPIKTKDGWMELNMAAEDVVGAITVLQMNAEEAAEAIKDIPNEEPLILIDALEDRKTVKAAITERVEKLKAPEGGEPDKEPEQHDGSGGADNDENGEPSKEPGDDGQAGGQKTGDA